jgi:hypothetical protein
MKTNTDNLYYQIYTNTEFYYKLMRAEMLYGTTSHKLKNKPYDIKKKRLRIQTTDKVILKFLKSNKYKIDGCKIIVTRKPYSVWNALPKIKWTNTDWLVKEVDKKLMEADK